MTMAAGADDARRDLPWVISADDHVVEPPDLWERWLPAKHRARGPRVEPGPTTEVPHAGGSVYVRGGDGPIADWWVFEDVVRGTPLVMACAGYPEEEYSMMPMRFADMRTGCYDPTARLADMDEGHIERSLNFPNYPRFAGQLFSEAKDKELALACVEAWNDWMIEEWCGDSGGRLIPLCIVPLWDPRTGGGRGAPQRGARAEGDHVHGAARQPRPALDPRQGPPLGPAVPGVRRDRHRHLHAHRIRIGAPTHELRLRPRASRPRSRRSTRTWRWPTGCCPGRCCDSRTSRSPSPRARSGGCRSSSIGSTASSRTVARGPTWTRRSPSSRRRRCPGACSAASSTTWSASTPATRSASSSSSSRPTTRIRTRPGRTRPSWSPRSRSG